MSKHLSLDDKKAIVNYYHSKPMTTEYCANHFGLSIPTVQKVLKMFHVNIYNKAILFSPDLDEHYFDVIDCPQKAYWLGFLNADGCIHVKKNNIKILCMTTSRKDEYLIEAFLKDINCNKKIVHNRQESSVQISSNVLCNALAQYGIVPNKTGKEQFNCPNYTEAYLHGLIDADGSFGYYARPDRKSCHRKSIRLRCANTNALTDCINYVGFGRIEKSSDNLMTIDWSTNDAMMRVIGMIKRYNTTCLIRKMEIANKIEQEIGKYRDNRSNTAS